MDKNIPIFKYVEPEENSGYLLWQVTMKWQLEMNRALKKMGLTLTQFSLMAGIYWLNQKKEKVTQQRLADYAGTDKMMTSKVLATLEKKQFLKRIPDPSDSRAKLLIMTGEGTRTLRSAYQVVEKVDEIYFKNVANEKPAFDQLLMKLIN